MGLTQVESPVIRTDISDKQIEEIKKGYQEGREIIYSPVRRSSNPIPTPRNSLCVRDVGSPPSEIDALFKGIPKEKRPRMVERGEPVTVQEKPLDDTVFPFDDDCP